ncbi:MAG: hypothetical protein CFE24_09270 [Flavobacterium sp. BFFFF2]|nr:MAG: hypothetical protein CFE24_09270 [Flavobacterium sp. BFFFF2]
MFNDTRSYKFGSVQSIFQVGCLLQNRKYIYSTSIHRNRLTKYLYNCLYFEGKEIRSFQCKPSITGTNQFSFKMTQEQIKQLEKELKGVASTLLIFIVGLKVHQHRYCIPFYIINYYYSNGLA